MKLAPPDGIQPSGGVAWQGVRLSGVDDRLAKAETVTGERMPCTIPELSMPTLGALGAIGVELRCAPKLFALLGRRRSH